MDLKDEYALSFYKQIGTLDAQQGIHLVRHTETGEFFVCKHLAACDCDVAVYRALQHSRLPGIPLIHELVENDGELIIIEEFFQGQLLTLHTEYSPNISENVLANEDILPERKSFSEEWAIDLTLQLACVVQNLHRLNPPIIHGNLLPSNVVVSTDGELRLYDFRAARFAVNRMTAAENFNHEKKQPCKQPESDMAPGTASDLISVHKDIQSIGEILCFLLTGMPQSEKIADEQLASIVAKCTEVTAAGRYKDISDLIADLHESLDKNNAPEGIGNGGMMPSWCRFLPPGFRSGKLVNMAAAAAVYAFLILILYLEIRYGSDDPVIFGTLMISFLVIVLFTADYVGVQTHLPLTRSGKTAVRVFGILLYDTLILVAAMVIAAALYTVVHT